MKVASIDIETTGLDPKIHSVTEVGIVLGDTDTGVVDAQFHLWVCPEDMVWSSYCLSLHRDWMQACMSRWEKRKTNPPTIDIVEPVNLKDAIEAFLKKNEVRKNYIPAGKNFGSFDRQFLARQGIFSFKHRQLDPAAYFHRKGDEVPPDLKACKKRAMEENASLFENCEVLHDALADAHDVFKLLSHAMPRFERLNGQHD